MFAEEKPSLQTLPLEPFRYYQYGERTVHLDGCVEVEAAYYGAPPGWIGRKVNVQWDAMFVRLLDPRTGKLLREHLGRSVAVIASAMRIVRGVRRSIRITCWRALTRPGPTSALVCDAIHHRQAEAGVRRIMGVLSLAKKYGSAACRSGLRSSAGAGRERVSLRAPLSGAQPASASDPAAGRSSHP